VSKNAVIFWQTEVITGVGRRRFLEAILWLASTGAPCGSPADWWTVALGSGLRWTVDQIGPVTAARVREDNLRWIEEHNVTAIETNAIYAVARKP
jgi:hypothetical protein